MYYSSGNYEAFATPKKPEGVDHKSAYIMAGAALAAVPIIIIFLIFQKYFTKGIAMGAVKG